MRVKSLDIHNAETFQVPLHYVCNGGVVDNCII